MIRLLGADSQRAAEAEVRRAAARIQQRLDPVPDPHT
jgi:hypothetical protein